VLPTAELECFGIIALEALACGCPVLANAVGSIPEILNNFERSWLTSTPDAKGVANLMLDFLNRKLPVHLGQELREKVISKYSKQKVLKELAATVLGSARD
jgi:glycosyltransferase involved in cell wall biosynthesis